jgi:hypothetical protein
MCTHLWDLTRYRHRTAAFMKTLHSTVRRVSISGAASRVSAAGQRWVSLIWRPPVVETSPTLEARSHSWAPSQPSLRAAPFTAGPQSSAAVSAMTQTHALLSSRRAQRSTMSCCARRLGARRLQASQTVRLCSRWGSAGGQPPRQPAQLRAAAHWPDARGLTEAAHENAIKTPTTLLSRY